MLLRPGLLEPPDGRGRQPAGVLAEQCDQGFLKVAGRQALEVEDRDQHFEAFRAARVRRQNRRRKADALRTFTGTVTYTRAAHGDRTDAGHDLALGQMPVAHQPLATVIGQLVGMAGEQDCDFGLHRLRQQRSRAVAQNLGQRVRKSSWLAELENVSVGHGVSLLRWRSGGVKHPHDTPPYPFMPSPTFAYSSRANPKSTWFGILPHSRKVLKLMEERHEPQTILACNASDPKCPGRAYRRLRSHRRPFDLDDSQEFGGLDAAAQTNRRYRVCRGPADRHDLTPSVWVDWPLRPRDSRMGHHLCGVTGKPSRRSGRQGPYFRSSSLARDDDHLHAPGRPWLIRAVARASGDGGDACSSPHLRCGSGCGLRQSRP